MTASSYPPPKWLHLSEVPAYVMEQMGSAPLEIIVRAFRDEEVQTRARCRAYTGHDTQTTMNGEAWDDATVDWDAGCFRRLGKRGQTHTFDKVDVLRAGVLGLDRWLGLVLAQTVQPPQVGQPSTKAVSQAKLERWYKKYVKQHAAAPKSPTRDADWKAAKEAFEGHVSRDRVWDLRRRFAPPEWTTQGRRPPKLR